MGALHHDIRRILGDRHGPEARELFLSLHGLISRRAASLVRTRYRDLLGSHDADEIVAEVLFTLMEGALGRFRGQTVGELHAFVRTITDRTTSRRVHRLLRERDTVREATIREEAAFARDPAPSPDQHAEVDAVSPLDRADRVYLESLVRAGSKAELARRQDVSRAAVTQRISRIRARVAGLPPEGRARHDAWLSALARDAVSASPEPVDS